MREKKLFQIGLILPVITFVVMTKLFVMSHPGKMALLSGLFLVQFIVLYKGHKFVDRARIVILSIFLFASVGIMFWQKYSG
tara:strand:- start:61475 stop:61717 length:243 start_codon:yes stop_codon:yes gene_type:complete